VCEGLPDIDDHRSVGASRDERGQVSGGNRSSSMTSFLVQAGYNAWSVAGGTNAWISADMPVVVGRHANVV
jgi:hypothetical protein